MAAPSPTEAQVFALALHNAALEVLGIAPQRLSETSLAVANVASAVLIKASELLTPSIRAEARREAFVEIADWATDKASGTHLDKEFTRGWLAGLRACASESSGRANACQPAAEAPKPQPPAVDVEGLAKAKRTCNRHDDCDAADAKAKQAGRLSADHCHDDCCPDCFGD